MGDKDHILAWMYSPLDGDYTVIDNINPLTGKAFENVLQLRNAKNKNYLYLGNLVKNFMLVRYEDICNDPKGFLDYLSKTYELPLADAYQPIENYKGSHVPYVKKEYFPLTSEELEYINSHLNWEIERIMGYHSLSATKDF